jgi:phage-related protein
MDFLGAHPLLAIAAIFIGLFVAWMEKTGQLDEFLNMLMDTFDEIMVVLQPLKDLIFGTGEGTGLLTQLMEALQPAFEAFMDLIVALLPTFVNLVGVIAKLLEAILPALIPLVEVLAKGLAIVFNVLAKLLVPIIEHVLIPAIMFFTKVIEWLVEALTGNTLSVAIKIVTMLLSPLMAIVEVGIKLFSMWFKIVGKLISKFNIFKGVGAIFGKIGGALGKLGDKFSKFRNKVSDAMGDIKESADRAWGRFKSFFVGDSPSLIEVGIAKATRTLKTGSRVIGGYMDRIGGSVPAFAGGAGPIGAGGGGGGSSSVVNEAPVYVYMTINGAEYHDTDMLLNEIGRRTKLARRGR